eukprot:6214179-Pleurochrysis_carterae.AAC.2
MSERVPILCNSLNSKRKESPPQPSVVDLPALCASPLSKARSLRRLCEAMEIAAARMYPSSLARAGRRAYMGMCDQETTILLEDRPMCKDMGLAMRIVMQAKLRLPKADLELLMTHSRWSASSSMPQVR